MQNYELLLQCYRSGQISEKQWQEHLADEEFSYWLDVSCADQSKIYDESGASAGFEIKPRGYFELNELIEDAKKLSKTERATLHESEKTDIKEH